MQFKKTVYIAAENKDIVLTESDYINKISDLESELSDLRAKVSLFNGIEEENKTLRLDLAQLKAKFDALLVKFEQSLVKKDSSNSSLAPSRDIYKKNQSLRTKSGLKPGGQIGHKGTTLKMTSNPDDTKELFPSYCNRCGDALDASKAEYAERRQVIDIPPIYPQTVEYKAFGVKCACGHHQIASFPDGVDNHIQYGPNISAITAYLSVYQYVPYQRLQYYFKHICNVQIGIGTLDNIIVKMANKARPLWWMLKAEVEKSKNVGGDETSAKVNGSNYWIWVWQNAVITFLAVSQSRGFEIIAALFPEGFKNAVLNSDRWNAQLKTYALKHQLCLPHILRELNYLIEIENHEWAIKFKALLLKSIKHKRSQTDFSAENIETIELEKELDILLDS